MGIGVLGFWGGIRDSASGAANKNISPSPTDTKAVDPSGTTATAGPQPETVQVKPSSFLKHAASIVFRIKEPIHAIKSDQPGSLRTLFDQGNAAPESASLANVVSFEGLVEQHLNKLDAAILTPSWKDRVLGNPLRRISGELAGHITERDDLTMRIIQWHRDYRNRQKETGVIQTRQDELLLAAYKLVSLFASRRGFLKKMGMAAAGTSLGGDLVTQAAEELFFDPYVNEPYEFVTLIGKVYRDLHLQKGTIYNFGWDVLGDLQAQLSIIPADPSGYYFPVLMRKHAAAPEGVRQSLAFNDEHAYSRLVGPITRTYRPDLDYSSISLQIDVYERLAADLFPKAAYGGYITGADYPMGLMREVALILRAHDASLEDRHKALNSIHGSHAKIVMKQLVEFRKGQHGRFEDTLRQHAVNILRRYTRSFIERQMAETRQGIYSEDDIPNGSSNRPIVEKDAPSVPDSVAELGDSLEAAYWDIVLQDVSGVSLYRQDLADAGLRQKEHNEYQAWRSKTLDRWYYYGLATRLRGNSSIELLAPVRDEWNHFRWSWVFARNLRETDLHPAKPWMNFLNVVMLLRAWGISQELYAVKIPDAENSVWHVEWVPLNDHYRPVRELIITGAIQPGDWVQ